MADKTQNIKTQLTIDGEREYKAACDGISNSLKTLGSEMKLATAQYADNAKGAEALRAKQDILKNTLTEQNKKVEEAEKMLALVRQEYGENSTEVQKYERELNYAKKAVIDTENQLKNIDGELKQSKINWEAVGDAVVAGAKVIGAAVVALGTATVAAGKAMYDMATATAAAGDRIDKSSQKLGLSAEGFQEWDYILSQNGASIDSLGAGMKTLTKTLDGLTEDGGKASDAFAAIGINFDDVKGKSPEEAFSMTIAALQRMPEGSAKTAAALKLLGKQGMELAPLLNSSAEATEGLRQQAHDLGMIMSGDCVKASADFTDSMDNMKRTVAGVKNQISANLLPGLADVTNAFAGLIAGQEGAGDAMKAGMETLIQGISAAIPQILDMVGDIAFVIADLAPGIINALVVGIVDNLPILVDVAITLINTIVDAIIGALPLLIEGAVQIIIQLAGAIADAMPKLIPQIAGLVMFIVDTLIKNIPLLVKAALQLVIGLAKGIIEAIPVLIEAVPEVISSIITAVLESIPLIIEAGIELLIALVRALPEIITAIVAAIPQIISGILDALIDNIDLIIEAGVQLFIALVENLPQIILAIVAAIPQIIEGIVGAFTGAVPKMAEAGIELLMGLAEGIMGAAGAVIDKVKDVGGQILGGIKDFFGIKSPSTVFAEVGGDLAAGIGVGFDQEADGVERQMAGAIGGAGAVTAQEAINAINKGIAENIAQLDQAANAIVDKVLAAIAAQHTKFVNQGVDLDKQIAAGMVNGIEEITAKVPQIVQSVVTAFVAQNTKFINQGIDYDKKIGSGMVSGISEITSKVSQVIASVISAFAAENQRFSDQGAEFDRQMAAGMVSGVEGVTAAVADVINPVIEAIRSFYDQFTAAGEYCVEGIWQGFQNMQFWLEDRVRGMMQSLIYIVEDEMDIASPSKVFAKIGGYMAEGIGVGFERGMRGVERQIRGALPTAARTAEAGSGSGDARRIPRAEAGGKPSGVSVTQNFYTDPGDYAKQQYEAAKQFRLIARAMA